MKTFWTIWALCAALFIGSLYATGVRADEDIPLPAKSQKVVDEYSSQLKTALDAFATKLESMGVSKTDGDALVEQLTIMMSSVRDMNQIIGNWKGALSIVKYYHEHPDECPGASEGTESKLLWKRM